MLIELCGPSGVGKTYLLNRFNSMMGGIVFPDTKINNHFNPVLGKSEDDTEAVSNQTDNKCNLQLENFANFCMESISRNSMNAYQKLGVAKILDTSVNTYRKLKPKSDYGYVIMHDELLLHRAFSFLPYSSDFENDVRAFYNIVPLPDAVCFCKAPVEIILNRLNGRQREVNFNRGKSEEEKADLIRKSLEVCELGEKILRERGVKVLTLDLSKDEEFYCAQLKDFVEKIREEYKNTLYNRLIEASGDFRSLRFLKSKGERHILINQGVAYCSFRTPQFTVSAGQSERDSEKRLNRFDITEYHLQGKTVLDLGSNCGAMLFQASNYGIKQGVGIEYDRDKVVLANQIAALSNLQNVAFFQGDIDELSEEKTGKFDVVFALAIEAHVRDFEHLLRLLSQITEGVLYFEGNSKCDVGFVEMKLKEFGFIGVEFLGFCDDDIRPQNNSRPMIKAIKNVQNKEMQKLIKQIQRLNSQLQNRDKQLKLKENQLQKEKASFGKQLKLKENQLQKEKASWNYRVGSAVLWLPKKVYYLFK